MGKSGVPFEGKEGQVLVNMLNGTCPSIILLGLETSVVRQADCHLLRALRPRLTFSKMSLAEAVQINGLGSLL